MILDGGGWQARGDDERRLYAGWELTNLEGVAVTRMSARFQPPPGEIVAVRVAAILVRQSADGVQESMRCQSWELALPLIECLPETECSE